MRRHRSLVLLVPAVMLSAAACSGRDDASTQNPLDRDLTLSAQLTRGQQDSSALAELASGGACKTEPTPAAPTAAQRAQAATLEQRAGEAEFVGNIQAARELHRQAARLDGRSEEIAYRLARADEAVGDKSAAVKGYCRYLSLAPTAANAKEVRTRLMALASPTPTQVATQSSQMSQQPAPVAATPARARSATQARSRATYVSSGRAATQTPTVATTPSTSAAAAAPSAADSATSAPAAGAPVYGTSAGEVTEGPSTTAQTPSTTTRRGSDHTARNAAIGAAAGAAIGAVIDRSAKGAIIGGVAGGVLGAVVGRTTSSRTSGFRTPGWAN